MRHAKAVAIVVAHNMHLEAATGRLNPDWKLDKKNIIDFRRFREKLSTQMLKCSPKQCKYPGDEFLREATQTPTKYRHKRYNSPTRRSDASSSASSASNGVTKEMLMDFDRSGLDCGYLSNLQKHIKSVKPIPNNGKRVRVVCGKDSHQMCVATVEEQPCTFLINQRPPKH